MRQMKWADVVPLGHFPMWGIGPWRSWADELKWIQSIVRKYAHIRVGKDSDGNIQCNECGWYGVETHKPDCTVGQLLALEPETGVES